MRELDEEGLSFEKGQIQGLGTAQKGFGGSPLLSVCQFLLVGLTLCTKVWPGTLKIE